MSKLWSENIAGNLHTATAVLNKIGVSDVVAMECVGGRNTVVVYRLSDEEYDAKMEKLKERNQRMADKL